MNAGKLAAQVAHASLGIFTQEFKNNNLNELNIKFDLNNKHDKAKLEWLKGRFTKVILLISLTKNNKIANHLTIIPCEHDGPIDEEPPANSN